MKGLEPHLSSFPFSYMTYPLGKIESYFNDFWQCDLKTLQWVQRNPQTNIVPSPRNRQSCIPYLLNGQRALLFFGGNFWNVQTRQGMSKSLWSVL